MFLHYRLRDSHDRQRQRRASLCFWVSTLQTQGLTWQTKTAEGIPLVSGFVHYTLSDSHDRQTQRRATPMFLGFYTTDSVTHMTDKDSGGHPLPHQTLQAAVALIADNPLVTVRWQHKEDGVRHFGCIQHIMKIVGRRNVEWYSLLEPSNAATNKQK